MPTTPRITPNTFHAAPHAPARRALLAGALALALPGLPGVRPARAAAPPSAIQWTLAAGYGPGVFMTDNLRQFAARLSESSQGRLQVQVQALGQPHSMADIRKATGEGAITGGQVLGSAMSAEFPIAGIDSQPFLTASPQDARRLWKYQKPVLEKDFAARGLKLLYAVPWPGQGLYAVSPLNIGGDLRGLRMRTYNMTTDLLAQYAGAQALYLPSGPALEQALQSGGVDLMLTSGATGVEMSAWRRFKYFYDLRAYYPKTLVFVSARAFNALDEALKNLVHQAARAAEDSGWTQSENQSLQALQTLQRNGMEVLAAPPGLKLFFDRFGERYAIDWIKQAGGSEASLVFAPPTTPTSERQRVPARESRQPLVSVWARLRALRPS